MGHSRNAPLLFLAAVLGKLTFVTSTVVGSGSRVNVGVQNDVLYGYTGGALHESDIVIRSHRLLEKELTVDDSERLINESGPTTDALSPKAEGAQQSGEVKMNRKKSKLSVPENETSNEGESKNVAPKVRPIAELNKKPTRDRMEGESEAQSKKGNEIEKDQAAIENGLSSVVFTNPSAESVYQGVNKVGSVHLPSELDGEGIGASSTEQPPKQTDTNQGGGAEDSGINDMSDGSGNNDGAQQYALNCKKAKSCEDCLDMAKTTSSNSHDEYTCHWVTGACESTKISKETTKFICLASDNSGPSTVVGTDQDLSPGSLSEGSSNVDGHKQKFIPSVVLLLVFVLAAYVTHKKVTKYRGRYSGGLDSFGVVSDSSAANNDGTFFSDEFSPGTSSIVGGKSMNTRRYNQETVPLSGAANDEWGWEDTSAGDIELGPSGGGFVDGVEDDLSQHDKVSHTAFALSLSENGPKEHFSSPQPKTKPTQFQPSRSIVGNNETALSGKDKGPLSSGVVGARQSTVATKDLWNDEPGWDDDEVLTPVPISSCNAIEAVAASSSNDEINFLIAQSRPGHVSAGSYITSLEKKAYVPPRKKNEETNKEADIFASMGLTAVPKFAPQLASGNGSRLSTPSSAPLGSGWRNTLETTSATNVVSTARNPIPVNGDDASEHGSNWDDDSDLDDLLDD